uniref:G-protein coupled receptors family 1 profile domain-containing protein n=1 Tax=Cavia porcellus TaxID=10141 RepID=A0A286Y5G4_CAVPO
MYEPTMNGNQSLCTTITFVALSSLAELQIVLFIIFLMMYLFTVGGNVTIICLIWVTPSLHTPMYLFLVNLSFLEMCYITSVVPQMLEHLLVKNKTISLGASTMAYDHFVAICYPLNYTIWMSPAVCLKLAAASWITGMTMEATQISWTFRIIEHFFCDIMPIVKLACIDTSKYEVVIFFLSLIILMSPCLFILCSYLRIFVTVFRIPSAAGRHTAFSTCSSHILVVSLFYGTSLFTYIQPKNSHTPDTDKATALMFTLVTPALNPVIYTLRNKEGSLSQGNA